MGASEIEPDLKGGRGGRLMRLTGSQLHCGLEGVVSWLSGGLEFHLFWVAFMRWAGVALKLRNGKLVAARHAMGVWCVKMRCSTCPACCPRMVTQGLPWRSDPFEGARYRRS